MALLTCLLLFQKAFQAKPIPFAIPFAKGLQHWLCIWEAEGKQILSARGKSATLCPRVGLSGTHDWWKRHPCSRSQDTHHKRLENSLVLQWCTTVPWSYPVHCPLLTGNGQLLAAMTADGQSFQWRPIHQKAFKQIKYLCSKTLVLKSIDRRTDGPNLGHLWCICIRIGSHGWTRAYMGHM